MIHQTQGSRLFSGGLQCFLAFGSAFSKGLIHITISGCPSEERRTCDLSRWKVGRDLERARGQRQHNAMRSSGHVSNILLSVPPLFTNCQPGAASLVDPLPPGALPLALTVPLPFLGV